MTHPTQQLCLLVILFLGTGCGESQEDVAESTAIGHTVEEQPESVINYRERLGRLKYQRDKLKRGLSRLHEDRSAILARFREAGIRSTKDLAEHPEWTIHARELRDVLDKSRRLENTVAAYSTAIVRVESVVRGLDREARLKGTKLSEEDLNLLSQTMHELDDQLRAASDIPAIEELELESLLERELPQE